MKEKDVLKIIKEDIKTDTPNVFNQIDIKNIEIEPLINEKKEKVFNLNKLLRLSLSFGILLIALVISYSLLNTGPGIDPGIKLSVTEKDQIIASYAVTGVNLIGNKGQNLNLALNDSIDFIDEFNDYFYLIEDYLNLNETNITITNNTDSDYDYQYKMVIKIKDLLNISKEYIMYYDESREIDDDEEEKIMKGIFIYDYATFNFYSEEEIEADESEIKLVIYENDKNNRIEIEKELEKDEYQYEYTIYKNNREIFNLELEVEDNEISLTIETNDYEYEYHIEMLSDNEFSVLYDEKERFKLIISNKYIYTYNDIIIEK